MKKKTKVSNNIFGERTKKLFIESLGKKLAIFSDKANPNVKPLSPVDNNSSNNPTK